MKVTQQQEAARQTVLEIELDDDDLDPYLDRAYRKVVDKTNIPGFRKGKAPRRVIEGFLGRERLIRDVMQFMLNDVTQKAIQEAGLDAGGAPDVDVRGLDPVQFSVKVPLTPSVELNDYSSIRLERQRTEVPSEEVEEALNKLPETIATWEPVDRGAAVGDLVWVDMEAVVGDESWKNENGQAVISMDDELKDNIPGLLEVIVGMASGDERTVSLPLPEPIADQWGISAGEAAITVRAREIKERVVPELDDDLARSLDGDFENLGQLRDKVRTNLESRAEATDESQLRDAAVAALLDLADLTIPDILVDRAANNEIARYRATLEQLEVDFDDQLLRLGQSREEFRQTVRARSLGQLRVHCALDALADAEGIEVSEDEVNERVSHIRRRHVADGKDEASLDVDLATVAARDDLRIERAVDRLVEIVGGEVPAEVKGDENDG